jgi:alpha,alpha-trehalase
MVTERITLGRSQPPFFALMIQLLAEEKGDSVFTKYQGALEKEYEFWMTGEMEVNARQTSCNHVVWVNGNILNRYWDSKETARPEAYQEDVHIAAAAVREKKETWRNIRAAAASGWDFSSRWFKDNLQMATIQTTQLIPVDLNCLLLYMEQTLLHMYQLQQDDTKAALFNTTISKRITAIQDLCWNENRGCYFDFNFIDHKQEEHFNLATVFPLFFNVATTVQATRIAELVKEKFLHAGGLITTLYKTGQQWDAPNGWAPLQWMAYKGLKNYGFTELAASIKQHWTSNCEKVFAATGKMMEKYNVTDTTIAAGGGEYPNQDGFGWTNGVYLKMKSE